jgi:hypothetical protein
MKLDASAEAVRQLIARGKQRGYVTVDEVNAALPNREVSSEFIEDTLAALSEAGINIVDEDDGPEDGVTAPWNPPGPLSPLPLQPGVEAPLDAEIPRRESDFSNVMGQTH